MLWQQQRVLPESELETAEADILTRLAEVERKAAELRLQLEVVRHFKAKLVNVAPISNNGAGDEDEDDGTVGPSSLILDVLRESAEGMTRDQIFESVRSRLNTTSKNPRNLVVNILNRLEKTYDKVEREGEMYYLKGWAPSSSLDDFQPPPFEIDEEDDDLPF